MNLVWIFIDSVRRYYADDDRSRLEIMDKFSERSIEFTEVVTSAPSTVMSISAMMTGCHSFILGSNYNDFRFDRKAFPTLTSILQEKGWDCNSILMHPDIREKLTCLNMYPRRKWPEGFSHGKWWSNADIYKFLKDILSKENNNGIPEKKFWFIDYNCRKDPNISNKVEDTINLFYTNGYTHKNTIFILCSDHGYPDPAKGITPEILKKQKMTHDVFMTDDNIMIPFFLSLPGFDKSKKYNNQISTINIFPTLLDYLEIKPPNSDIKYAESLLPSLRIKNQKKSINKDYLARCDARFLGQSNRVCCIRSKNLKLIYEYETNKFSYTQISGLDEKDINIAKSDIKKIKLKEKLKNYLISTDKFALEIFNKRTTKKINNLSRRFNKKNVISVFVYSNSSLEFNKEIFKILNNHFLDKKLLIVDYSIQNKLKEIDFENITFKKIGNKFDMKIFLQIETINLKKDLKKFNSIKSKYSLILPASLSGAISKGRFIRAIKTIWNSRIYYIYEPILILKLLFKLIKNR